MFNLEFGLKKNARLQKEISVPKMRCRIKTVMFGMIIYKFDNSIINENIAK